MPKPHVNPFAQSPEYWKAIFTMSGEAAGTAEVSFDDIALAVSGFETDEENHIWTFDLLFAEKPDMSEIERRLFVLCELHNIPMPKLTLEPVERQDWLAKVARSFPPITLGRFYVHGTHAVDSIPAGSIPIQVDAGAAFGSGEHGTTSCCLKAIDYLAQKRRFSRVLDMGCGSGILAIAAAKMWKTQVLAVDVDPIAVQVTKENSELNKVNQWITTGVSDGYKSDHVKRGAPYDLILSNILARPLVEFAPELAKNLAPNGVAVLSGLLASQEKQVLSAHIMQGLKLQKRFPGGEWCTLVLSR